MIGQIRDLKITTLAENSVIPRYLGQWGLSFLLELVDVKGNNRKKVFDTGTHKESLLHNIKELKRDLSDVDCVVISHGHHDHTAATVEVVKAARSPKVYAHPHTFLPRFFIIRRSFSNAVSISLSTHQLVYENLEQQSNTLSHDRRPLSICS